jgi:hypothetical protein
MSTKPNELNVAPPPEPNHPANVALLLSLAFLYGCSFLAIAKSRAANPFANPAYFRGQWVGTLFWVLIILGIFAAIHNRRIRSSIKFLVIFGAGFLLGILILAKPMRQVGGDPNPSTLRQFADELKNPNSSSKWNAPGRALMKDLMTFNQQYVSDVSKIDATAQPLYTPESFRDAATIQGTLEELRSRLAVADKYSDLDVVFVKMKQYVASVDGSEKEKQEFLEGFESSLPKARAGYKALKDKERAWLQASVDLYQFGLSKQGTYALQNGNLIFKKAADSDIFNQKLAKARNLKTDFFSAYGQMRHTQEVMAAQLGLQGTEFDPNHRQ